MQMKFMLQMVHNGINRMYLKVWRPWFKSRCDSSTCSANSIDSQTDQSASVSQCYTTARTQQIM
jgi:hypothetical protein